MKDYAMYKDDDTITLICFNGDVYTIKDESHFIKEDGELNAQTPYAHLGKKLTIEEIENALFSEVLITIINL